MPASTFPRKFKSWFNPNCTNTTIQPKPIKRIPLTQKGVDIPDEISKTVSTLSGSSREIKQELAKRGHHHIYLDGGVTIQKFLETGLVDELTITKIPILIRTGILLFGPLSKDAKLKHLETKSYDAGFVQSRYEVLN